MLYVYGVIYRISVAKKILEDFKVGGFYMCFKSLFYYLVIIYFLYMLFCPLAVTFPSKSFSFLLHLNILYQYILSIIL